MRHITITDLARCLNLSASTVSRALRDHPDISPSTKKRVREMAKKTNYQPNLIAQSLQNRRSNNIGVIVPEIRSTFFSTVISGIEEVAYEAGYTIMVCQSNDTCSREIINIQALAANRVAGILLSISQETTDFSHLKTVMSQGIPLVLFDRIIEELEVSQVVVDDFDGAYGAVSHLIDRGHKKIAHLAGTPSLYVSRKRQEGYMAALRDHGLPVLPEYIISGGYHEEDGLKGAQLLWNLEKRPDAVFAINDPVALGAHMFFQDNGVTIPDEIALIGFSNNPDTLLVRPRLSTVNQPAFKMGKTAAKMMLANLKPQTKKRNKQTTVLKTHLIVRESS
jgi:LacI family transcriptional regulator